MLNRYRVLNVAAVVLVPVAIGAAAFSLLRPKPPVRAPVVISPETTFITGPLRADGTVDYAAAINQHYGSHVAPQDNAAVPLWEISREKVDPQFDARYRQALGMPLGPPACEFVRFDFDKYDRETAGVLDRQHREAMERPWNECEFPETLTWLRANEDALSKLKEASGRSEYYTPIICDPSEALLEAIWPALSHVDSLCDLLVTRAMFKLDAGHFDAAFEDLLTTLRLSRLLFRGCHMLDRFYGHRIETRAYAGLQQFLQQVPDDLELIQCYQTQLANVPARISATEQLESSERLFFLDFVARSPQLPLGGFYGDDRKELVKLLKTRIDINPVLRISNKLFDQYLANFREWSRQPLGVSVDKINEFQRPLYEPLQEREKAKGIQGSHVFIRDADLLYAYAVFLESDDVYFRSLLREYVAQQDWDLIDLGFRLAAYRATCGHYPRTLVELSQADAEPIPVDRYTLGSLRYVLVRSGYLLYSLGPNEHDDHGEYGDRAMRIYR